MSQTTTPLVALTANTAWYLYNFRKGLIEALIRSHWQVLVISPWDQHCLSLEQLGCRIETIKIDNKGLNPIKDTKTLVAYWRLLRKTKPDLVLSFTVKPVIYSTVVSGVLGISTISTITGLGTAFLSGKMLARFVSFLYRFSQRWASKVVFQNNEDQRIFVQRRIVKQKDSIKVSGSGIDIKRFSVVALPQTPQTVFVLIARLLWDKGLLDYIEAAKIVRDIKPQTCFYLVGPVDENDKKSVSLADIKEWENSGVISYLGEADDVRETIAKAHCVVLPSYREGLPRVLLEGAAMGRPLIATNVPGCTDIVDDSINGYLCNVKDPTDLAEKMLKIQSLSQSEISHMGINGRRKIEQEFDETFVIKTYLDLINQVISVGS